MSKAWEAAQIVEAHLPPDGDLRQQEITLKVRYADGRIRYVAVPIRGLTDKMKEQESSR